MYLAWKYQLRTLFLHLLLERTGPPFYVVIQATRRSSRLIEAMSIGPAPEIEPTPSRSEDKHSTDWANPATKW